MSKGVNEKMYTLKTENSFDAAHFLAGYDGKCKNIHGHRWRVIVTIQGSDLQKEGQMRGMLVDFSDIKKDVKEVTDAFDHAFIYEKDSLKENTVKALLEEEFHLIEVDFRPTAENFSEYFYHQIENRGYDVKCVEVYETPNNCASYSE